MAVINRFKLDEELEKHLVEVEQFSDSLSSAKAKMQSAKFEMDRYYANEFMLARRFFWDQGKAITDKALDAMVITKNDYVSLRNAFIKAQETVDKLEGLRRYHFAREFVIKSYIDLLKGGYF